LSNHPLYRETAKRREGYVRSSELVHRDAHAKRGVGIGIGILSVSLLNVGVIVPEVGQHPLVVATGLRERSQARLKHHERMAQRFVARPGLEEVPVDVPGFPIRSFRFFQAGEISQSVADRGVARRDQFRRPFCTF